MTREQAETLINSVQYLLIAVVLLTIIVVFK